MVKGSSHITHIDVEDDMCCDDTSKGTTMQQKDGKNAKESTHLPIKMYQIKRSDQGRHPEATHTPQSKFIRESPSWMNQRSYESVFKGYCFSCNEYGHKALDCRIMEENNLVGSTTV